MSEHLDLNVETSGAGDGVTVVLSHGVGSDAAVWSALGEVLADDRAVVAWDQPGHGKSPHLADPAAYGAGSAYAALQQVVAPFERVVLIGHSLGGYLSARYAIDHPERVAALVLIATGPGFRSADAREKWNADVRRGAEKQGRPETLAGLHADSHVMDHLADISCPTMVIVGSLDTPFLGATDYIERKVAGVERVTIDGADHMVPATHGAQIGALVRDFLRRRGIA